MDNVAVQPGILRAVPVENLWFLKPENMEAVRPVFAGSR